MREGGMRLSCESDAAQQSKGDAKDGGVHALAEPCEVVDPGRASCEGNSTIQWNAGDACEWCGRGVTGGGEPGWTAGNLRTRKQLQTWKAGFETVCRPRWRRHRRAGSCASAASVA